MKTFLLLLCLLPVVISGQSIFPVAAEDFPGASVVNINRYDPQTLSTYYNGDAGIFFELGFDSLLVQYLYWPTDKIKAEIYLMDSPEAALGLFSLLTGQCPIRDTLVSYGCMNRYQYQAAYGNFYINITSESGSEFAINNYLPVMQALMKRNPQKQFNLPDPFNLPRFQSSRGSLFFINGPVGLGMILFPWQQMFRGVRFFMYGIKIPVPQGNVYFARITFVTPDDQYRFLKELGMIRNNVPLSNITNNDGIYYEYQQADQKSIYFLQTQIPNQPYPMSALFNQ